MVAPAAVLHDHIPNVHEELSVPRRTVDRPRDRGRRHVQGLHLDAVGALAQVSLVVRGQHGILIAAEDAGTLAQSHLHDAELVGGGLDQGPAEQRREALQGEALALGAERLAAPRLVVVLRVAAGRAARQARRPVLILLVALRAGCQAALGVRAILVSRGALLLDPLCDLSPLSSAARGSARASGVAAPCRLPRLGRILARGARSLALMPVRALRVALLARIGAALLLAAVLPSVGALIRDPRCRPRRPRAELLARPRLPV
mmetsp:Transcript_3348/g.8052  ORF Transcript_3348/g.8052 Transcript_3348/m.8052 type:complete len:261 (+) Transcript_3348:775-1557(+)